MCVRWKAHEAEKTASPHGWNYAIAPATQQHVWSCRKIWTSFRRHGNTCKPSFAHVMTSSIHPYMITCMHIQHHIDVCGRSLTKDEGTLIDGQMVGDGEGDCLPNCYHVTVWTPFEERQHRIYAFFESRERRTWVGSPLHTSRVKSAVDRFPELTAFALLQCAGSVLEKPTSTSEAWPSTKKHALICFCREFPSD